MRGVVQITPKMTSGLLIHWWLPMVGSCTVVALPMDRKSKTASTMSSTCNRELPGECTPGTKRCFSTPPPVASRRPRRWGTTTTLSTPAPSAPARTRCVRSVPAWESAVLAVGIMRCWRGSRPARWCFLPPWGSLGRRNPQRPWLWDARCFALRASRTLLSPSTNSLRQGVLPGVKGLRSAAMNSPAGCP
jgi:hypothetical protein